MNKPKIHCLVSTLFLFFTCTTIFAEVNYPHEALDIAFEYAEDHWGPTQLFDAETYYNLDDTPRMYVFTFYRGVDNPPNKQAILNRTRQLYQKMEGIRQEIEQIKESSLEEEEKQKQIEELEWELLNVKYSQRGKAEFCAVSCAADTLEITQASSRLPRHIVQLPILEEQLYTHPVLSDLAFSRIYYSRKFNVNYLLSPVNLRGKGIRSLPTEAASKAKLIRFDGQLIYSADRELEQLFQTESEISNESASFFLSSVNPATDLTVVITHGYQLTGSLPAWVVDMAEAIRVDLLGGAKIFDFNKSSGQFLLNTSRSDLSSGHSILIMNWDDASNDDGQGYTESAGDSLFQALLYGEEQGDFSVNHLHFIGHSRGTVVNGEAVERLLYTGYPVIQVSTLDPHDSGFLGLLTDYDANPTLSNQGVVSWQGIQWADNYYSTDGGLDGIHLDGTYETYFGSFLNHSEMHDWYHGTIDPDFSTPSDWYGTGGRPARDVGGFNHARTILGNGNPPSESGSRTAVQFRFGSANQGIMNGDFRRNDLDVISGDYFLSGWRYFGGSGSANVHSGHLELDKFDDNRTHNYFYFPPEATMIEYKFKIFNAEELFEPKDEFQFLIDNTIVDSFVLDHTTSSYETRTIPLVDVEGSHKRITLRIAPGTLESDSEVHVDDIKFVVSDWSVPQYGSLTVFIEPNEIRDYAQWRLTTGTDTTWKAHGQTIYGLPVGDYTLEFTSSDADWKPPVSRTVTIFSGENTEDNLYSKYVYFPDANLKTAIEARLGVQNPSEAEMLNLTIFFSSNDIADLTGLEYALNLTRLGLGNNQLTSLPGSLGDLTSLVDFYLYNNQITSLPSEIGNLVNLNTLWLYNNQLTSLPPEIGFLTNLVSLRLENNQLTNLPSEIGDLNTLSELNLQSNQLASLPSQIGDLANLTNLLLDHNQLGILPESIGNMSNLTSLYLNDNQLTSLPESIGNMSSLTYLYLYHNQLTELPISFGNLSMLSELHISDRYQQSGNQLTSLPDSFGNLTNLTKLYLSSNQLTTLPMSFGNLTNLTELQINYNQLSNVPDSIGNLTNLTKLYLSTNQLSNIPDSIGNLTNLTYLHLSHNQLSSIPESIGNLTNLSTLNLGYNQLKSLPGTVSNLTRLRYLELSNNQLTSLPSGIVALTNLINLHLLGNQLNSRFYCLLMHDIIDNNPTVNIYVHSNTNPISADCSTGMADFSLFSAHWQEIDCNETNSWCDGADLNHDAIVSVDDLAEFSYYWLFDEEIAYTLSVSSSGVTGVSITSSTDHGGTTNYAQTIAEGTTVTLAAPTTSGSSTFSEWTGSTNSGNQTISLIMSSNQSVLVNYTPMPFLNEDFETGDFSSYPWQHAGDFYWTITNDGNGYVARTGVISDSQQSILQITRNNLFANLITFAI